MESDGRNTPVASAEVSEYHEGDRRSITNRLAIDVFENSCIAGIFHVTAIINYDPTLSLIL